MKKPKVKSKGKPGPKEPSKWNDVCVKKLEEAFSIGCTVTEAALYAGIDRKTFYNHCPEGSDLFLKFDAMRDRPILKARSTVVKNLDNLDNAWKYLRNKRRDEFAEKSFNDVQSGGEKIEGFNFIIKKDNEAND